MVLLLYYFLLLYFGITPIYNSIKLLVFKFAVRNPYVWFICFCTLFLYWGNNVSRKSLGQSLLEQECLFKHYSYVIQSDLLERSLVTLSTSKKQLMPKVQSEVTLTSIV